MLHTATPGEEGAGVADLIVDDRESLTLAVPKSIPSDIGGLIKCLVKELVKAPRPSTQDQDDDGQILLDVEVGDVRLLALRRGPPRPTALLSPRELEIARMVASGYPNKTIASVLEISSWTVASHLRRIYMKLQVSSRAAMATRLSVHSLNELISPPAESTAGRFSSASPEGKR